MFVKKSLVSLVTKSPPDDAINTQEVVMLMSSGHQGTGEWPEKQGHSLKFFFATWEALQLKASETWADQSQLAENGVCYVATKPTLKHFSRSDYMYQHHCDMACCPHTLTPGRAQRRNVKKPSEAPTPWHCDNWFTVLLASFNWDSKLHGCFTYLVEPYLMQDMASATSGQREIRYRQSYTWKFLK